MCSRFLLFVNIINDRSFSFFSLALKKIDLSNYTLSLQAYSVDILHQYNDQPLSFHTVDMSHLSSRSYLWISLSTSPLLSLSWQLQVLPNGNVFSPGCKTCNVSCTSLSDDSWGIRFLNLEHRHTWMTTKMITTTEHMSNNYSLITKNLKHDLRWWMKHYLNNHLSVYLCINLPPVDSCDANQCHSRFVTLASLWNPQSIFVCKIWLYSRIQTPLWNIHWNEKLLKNGNLLPLWPP